MKANNKPVVRKCYVTGCSKKVLAQADDEYSGSTVWLCQKHLTEHIVNNIKHYRTDDPTKEEMFAEEIKREIQDYYQAVEYELNNKRNLTQPTLSFIEGERAVLEKLNKKVEEFFRDKDLPF